MPKTVLIEGKRKSCRARVLFHTTEPTSYINNVPINYFPEINEICNMYMPKIYFKCTTFGGGVTGSMQAVLLCIFKFIISQNLAKKQLIKVVYPDAIKSNPSKKWKKLPQGRGARSRRQKSYR